MPLAELTMASAGPSAKPSRCRHAHRPPPRRAGHRAVEDRCEAVVRGQSRLGERVTVLGEDLGEERLDDVAEEDGVGDLHHRRLEVDGEEHTLVLGPLDLRPEELVESGDIHLRRIDDLAGEHGQGLLEDDLVAGVGDEHDAQGVIGAHDDGLLVRAEVIGIHRRDVRLRLRRPCAHRMRVLLRVVLNGLGGAAVGVALAQDRVDGRSLDLVVAGLDVLVLVRLRLLRVVGEVEALGLQFGDRGLELRDGGGDVGELDDVGLGGLGELPEFGQCVGDLLVGRETIGELCEHTGCQGDVPGLDIDARRGGEGFDDRLERVGRQQGRFIGACVDDFGHGDGLLRIVVGFDLTILPFGRVGLARVPSARRGGTRVRVECRGGIDRWGTTWPSSTSGTER